MRDSASCACAIIDVKSSRVEEPPELEEPPVGSSQPDKRVRPACPNDRIQRQGAETRVIKKNLLFQLIFAVFRLLLKCLVELFFAVR